MFLEPKDLTLRFDDKDVSGRATDALERLAFDYVIGIEEAISDCAEMYTPIFDSELYRSLPTIREYLEEGVEEYSIAINERNFDLIRMIQGGYWYFLTKELREHLPDALFNHFVQLNDVTDIPDERENDFLVEIDDLISDFCKHSGNRTFKDFDNAVGELVSNYKEGE